MREKYTLYLTPAARKMLKCMASAEGLSVSRMLEHIVKSQVGTSNKHGLSKEALMANQIGITLFTKSPMEGIAKTLGSRRFQASWTRAENVQNELAKMNGDTMEEVLVNALAVELMREMPVALASILVDGMCINVDQETRKKYKDGVVKQLEPFMDEISKARLIGPPGKRKEDC